MTVAEPAVSFGPGADMEADGILLGVQDLPMVGAAGVLVLPPRPTYRQTARKGGEVDPSDVDLFGDTDLIGWGPEAEREARVPFRMFEAAQMERIFSEYIAAETSGSSSGSAAVLPQAMQPEEIEQVKALATESGPVRPKEGPGLLQLAKDPKRREECPVCAQEWSQALRQLNLKSDRGSEAPREYDGGEAASRRYSMSVAGGRQKKIHSLRCNWLWFQQSLCNSLCALRFDARGEPRPRPGSPSGVLPPPMYDVWHYWRQKSRGDRDRDRDRAAATERLVRGEPAG